MIKKTLGILGGMGPRATAHFYGQLVDLTQAEKDWDHLHVIIDSDVHIPSRTRAVLYKETSPVKGMRKACFQLMDVGCKYIGVPCNSAHYFYDEVVAGYDIPWVNMIKVVAEELKDFKNVLVLGGYTTITKKTYDEYLDTTVYLSENDIVYNIIEGVKVNNTTERLYNLYDIVHSLYDRINCMDVDCVLLACTELPIILKPEQFKCDMIDGSEVYIKKLIKICGGNIKDE